MICDTCKGSGQVPEVGRWGPWLIQGHKPCADCGGFGIIHCCEGDQAQPSDSAKELVEVSVISDTEYERMITSLICG